MPREPLFAGLVVDEDGNPVEIAYVGNEPCYVVNDAGFRRHIPSEQVDLEVLRQMREMIRGNEGEISAQAAKMIGQDDLFTRAMIETQLKNLEAHFNTLLETGLPEETRAYLGMMGFKLVINVHGEIVRLEQPGIASDED
ncbi:MAG: hypothetical protein ACK4VW_03335 [Anaerolineales bacterium]